MPLPSVNSRRSSTLDVGNGKRRVHQLHTHSPAPFPRSYFVAVLGMVVWDLSPSNEQPWTQQNRRNTNECQNLGVAVLLRLHFLRRIPYPTVHLQSIRSTNAVCPLLRRKRGGKNQTPPSLSFFRPSRLPPTLSAPSRRHMLRPTTHSLRRAIRKAVHQSYLDIRQSLAAAPAAAAPITMMAMPNRSRMVHLRHLPGDAAPSAAWYAYRMAGASPKAPSAAEGKATPSSTSDDRRDAASSGDSSAATLSTPAAPPPPSTTISSSSRQSSDEEIAAAEQDDAFTEYKRYATNFDFETTTKKTMRETHGEGTYDLFRALYKELCDEMRREIATKPPPPIAGWRVEHDKRTNGCVGFIREAPAGSPPGTSSVYAWARVELADPSQLNEVLTFVNWYPIEACVVRKGHVLHFAVAYSEGNLHLRNVRAYKDESGALSRNDVDTQYIRTHLRYDGPYLGHMEMDMQTELTDMMLDAGVDPDFLRFCGSWIAYLEHKEYVRWLLSNLRFLLLNDVPDDTLVLTREEREELDTLAEEWLPAHHV